MIWLRKFLVWVKRRWSGPGKSRDLSNVVTAPEEVIEVSSRLHRDLKRWSKGEVLEPLHKPTRLAPAPKKQASPAAKKKPKKKRVVVEEEVPKDIQKEVVNFLKENKKQDRDGADRPIEEGEASTLFRNSRVFGELDHEDDTISMGLLTIDDMRMEADSLLDDLDEARSSKWGKRGHEGLGMAAGEEMTPGELRTIAKNGIYVFADVALFDTGRVTTNVSGLPSVATVAFCSADKERTNAEFSKKVIISVQRESILPPNYVPTGEGWPFRVTKILWFDKGGIVKKGGWCEQHEYVTISGTGEVSVCHKYVMARNTFRSYSAHQNITVPVMRCVNPNVCWVDDQNKNDSKAPKRPIEYEAALALNAFSSTDQQWNAEFSKGNGRVVFNFDYRLARRLFSERKTVTTVDGRRRSILHFVAGHTRQTDAGQSEVKMHLRGERKFTVEGFDVEIFVPGKHRRMRGKDGWIVNNSGWVTDIPWYQRLWSTRRVRSGTKEEIKALEKDFDPDKGFEFASVDADTLRNILYYQSNGEPISDYRRMS